MPGYYDLVLALIPLVLFGTAGALHLAGLTVTGALSVASVAALCLVGHALFVRAPDGSAVSGPPPRTD